MKDNILLKLKDGGIVEISTDKDSMDGCPTCGYGGRYTNHYDIELTKSKVQIRASEMYDYPLTDDYMMKAILPNIDLIREMTEKEFVQWIENKLNAELEYTDLDINIV